METDNTIIRDSLEKHVGEQFKSIQFHTVRNIFYDLPRKNHCSVEKDYTNYDDGVT